MSRRDDRGGVVYGESALFVRDVMLAPKSDVLFYFEDAGQESVYDRFIKRLFPEIRRPMVLCLNGCSEVIKKMRSENVFKKPRVGIIDLDFRDLLGQLEDIPGLVNFKKHCFENYLINRDALLEIAIERMDEPARQLEAEEKIGDYESFYDRLVGKYEELARYFIVARRQKVPIETTKVSPSELVDGEVGGLSEDWVENYKTRFLAACEESHTHLLMPEILHEDLEQAFSPPEGIVVAVENTPIDHFSGKHLLYFMTDYFDRRLGSKLLELSVLQRYLAYVSRVPADTFATIVEECWEDIALQARDLDIRMPVPPEFRLN
ncbi:MULTISPECIES: DUF4435 domain-containing protein [Burkholderia]|uniref:DUF4435 domain-containing protein n=1 Tax=Burkholderia aenigmatica TaxID=2015348 RepID=A0ABY6Y0S6_9BURK|nr:MULTISPECIES: DUF4435 domain-containing protein [Burkholderia]VWD16824.1 hypothetical protein BLA17378_06303 [Burkholderia aenigmatica]VWD19050.1 hypothetical protein BLA18628_03756 [Burkholderia aenigmatica]